MVDAWTSYGGSQFIDSSSTGPYMSYLCDEVVPFVDERYPTLGAPRPPRADRQVVGRLRRDGRADAAARRVRRARLALRRRAVRGLLRATSASPRASCATTSTAPTRSSSSSSPRPTTSTSTASPRRSRPTATPPATRPTRRAPGKALLPFEIDDRPASSTTSGSSGSTGIRCGWRRTHAEALRSMKRIYLDAGKRDEYYLDLGATAFAQRGREGRGDVHARAVRRHARRADVPLPGRDPRARDRARAVAPGLDRRPRAVAGLGVDVAGAGSRSTASPSGSP